MAAAETNGKAPPPAGAAAIGEEEKRAFLDEWPPLGLTASSADYYFNSYNHYGVHEDVLKDGVTISCYQKAIKQNAHLLRGAVVLDVSAGLGLLSLLAAQAGAKRVIALEPQQELVAMGTKIARKNGFGPGAIDFVHGSAFTLEGLPDGIERVDVIVSQWMGYFLLYEARLGEVIKARDRWLKPGGLLFPDRAKIHVGLLEDAQYREHHFDFYKSVWGFDFSSMQGPAHGEPVVNCFEQSQLMSTAACILDLDLYHSTMEECFHFASNYQVTAKRDGRVNALVFWFEIRFDSCHKPIAFATGPESSPTCWKQTAFFLGGTPPGLKQGDRVKGMVAVRQPAVERRNLDVKVSFRVNACKPRLEYYRWS